ncbi:MAG: GTP pyrophosphokinase family protein [Clostridia bacterium]|nr:GTP pyrophosphokinase family protein [Clostridia bacterium]
MSLLDLNHANLTQTLLSRLFQSDIRTWLLDYAQPYKELMAYYRCAMMEVSTKFQVLNEEFSLQYDRNPIEGIKTRLKSLESVIEKLSRKQLPLSIESIEQNINDIAGVRVVCSYQSDIYMLADAFLRQDDIVLIQRKDYIQNPKPNGYRSLHLIVETPIYLHNQKKPMKVEVQFRTISMDWWASLEHKIRYKKNVVITDQIAKELYDCAAMGEQLDLRMERIQRSVEPSPMDTKEERAK